MIVIVNKTCQHIHILTSNKGEHAVGAGNNNRIERGGFSAGTVRAVRCHDAHGYSKGEKDLRHCRRPHVRFVLEDIHFPLADVFHNTFASAIKENGLEEKHEQK